MAFQNEYRTENEIVYIELKNKKGIVKETTIDSSDLQKVIDLDVTWNVKYQKESGLYYAGATKYLGKLNGKYQYKFMTLHQFIIGGAECVDHIDNNSLNNCFDNLRESERHNNSKNRKSKNSNNKSGYRNVGWDKKVNKWKVQLSINKKNTIMGYFEDVHEAGEFAEEKRKELYGEYAGKNLPNKVTISMEE